MPRRRPIASVVALARCYGNATSFDRGSTGALLRSVGATVHHLIMSCEIVERGQGGPALGLDDGDIGIVPGKCLDGLDRVPQGHGEELHLAVDLAPQQIRTLVPGDVLQMRGDICREVTRIGLSFCRGRRSAPRASDHLVPSCTTEALRSSPMLCKTPGAAPQLAST